MCRACYHTEFNSPKPSPAARMMGLRLKTVSSAGGCHIVVGDWNLEDEDIRWVIEDWPETTEAEKTIMRDLLELSLDQRAAAMAVAEGYV